MRLFRILLILAISISPFIAQTPVAQAEEAPAVSFEGHGWGHGVGMSQYGARAMADDGHMAEDIVEHYYTDASATPLANTVTGWLVTDPTPLWVHLVSKVGGVTLSSVGGNLTLCQQEPAWVGSLVEGKNTPDIQPYNKLLEQKLFAEGHNPGNKDDGIFDAATKTAVMAFQTDNGLVDDGIVGTNTKNALWDSDGSDRCVVSNPLTGTAKTLVPGPGGQDCTLQGAPLAGDCRGSVRGLTTAKRVKLADKTVRNGTTIELARGTLRVRPDLSGGSGGFEGVHALVEISVDDYAIGIDEMPIGWPMQALEAQAIASRSYGVANAKNKGPESGFSGSLRDTCWCHLWSTTSSQVFAGYYPETILNGRWTTAAQATASQVLKHPAAGLVNAFFSSSNGGASEANEDAWGSVPVAYLRSVEDPWSLEPINPFANWSYTFPASSVAATVGVDELTGVAVVATNTSGSAKTVRFVGTSQGVEVSVDKTGAWVKTTFGLRSTHYTVEWGDVSGSPPPPPPGPSTFGDIADNTFKADIEWASETGVTKGCNPPANTLFCPNDKVTRGQMAAFIARFLNLASTSNDYFNDDDGSTFENDINKMAAAGITKGCGSGKFCPNDKVSREQMGAFIARALELTDASHPGFTDVPQSNTFHTDIAKLAAAGITKGCNPPSNSKYCPKDTVTRAQMTAFLHRAAGK